MSEGDIVKCKDIYWGKNKSVSSLHQVRNKMTLFQWMAAGVGIISASALMFSLIAVWKQDEKFNKEILTPVRNYLRKHS